MISPGESVARAVHAEFGRRADDVRRPPGPVCVARAGMVETRGSDAGEPRHGVRRHSALNSMGGAHEPVCADSEHVPLCLKQMRMRP